jgi:rubrerythrin
MAENKLFGGAPVIGFHRDQDRRNFLKWAGILGFGGTLAIVTRKTFASAQGDNRDIDILNYALTLEYLEADFYDQALQADLVSGRTAELIRSIHQHETEHVTAIETTVQDLGGTTVEQPSFTYPNQTFESENSFLNAAFDLETLTVKAYHGQVTNFTNGDLLAAAASIAGTESRHAAILADLTGNDPFPAPLEAAAPKDKVLQAARAYIEA